MSTSGSASRSYEESCRLLDRIVGRCVREPQFSARVLADPRGALREYALDEYELEDFLALQAGYSMEAAEVWAAIRDRLSRTQGEQ
jgi:hypothetical protein